ncbi:MAG: DUF4845 domain-containing protein [Candidatus Endonucleobacter sp. (ex Gigantidas childressi)]|nr:DUF4845 domain-containing protein [Candidatus Endonucleobacter sp. (ex Gigantidas childressi)]
MFKNKQTGASIVGIVAILCMVLSIAMLGIKIVPLYLDNIAMTQVVSSLDKQSNLEMTSSYDLKRWLSNSFKINRLTVSDDEVQVSGSGEELRLEISYERRVHAVYNIYLLLKFHHEWSAESK